MKRKVAIIVPSMGGGGAERVILNIINNIDKTKFHITLILTKKEGKYVELISSDISVIDLDSKRVRYSLIKIIKQINLIRPDVILSTLGHLNIALLAIKHFLKGEPKIIVREANTPSKNMSSLSCPKKLIYSYLYKYLYSKADIIVAQCQEMKDDIVKYFNISSHKVKCIYNPLDLEKIKLNREENNPYLGNKINIVSVGRLTYQKGFDILLKAFKVFSKRVPNAHLTILGEGELKDDLWEQAVNLEIIDKVTFTGFKNNPYPYFYYADIYVLSSRWEGFPNTLLEALACGTKVVATDCKSGPREIIGEDYQYGILVNEGDYLSLADGIMMALSEENKTQDRANFFSIKKIIKDYEEILISTAY